jgi:hypothetical protein
LAHKKTGQRRRHRLPIIHPITTISGRISNATCKLDPIATPIARSILSLQATVTAVACSAAFPTIGRRISPTKVVDKPPDFVIESIESTCTSYIRTVSPNLLD